MGEIDGGALMGVIGRDRINIADLLLDLRVLHCSLLENNHEAHGEAAVHISQMVAPGSMGGHVARSRPFSGSISTRLTRRPSGGDAVVR